MAATIPRYNYIISKTLDPLFALFIGVSAAGMRIRKEENEKRRGVTTTSMVDSSASSYIRYKKQQQQEREEPRRNGRRDDGRDDGEGKIGYWDIISVGWGRVKRKMGEVWK